jgi:6-phosphogluconolactonase
MYVSLQEDDKISIFTMDAATGKLKHETEVAVTGGPAPMTTDPEQRFLYVGRRGSRQLSSFRLDQDTGNLSLIRSIPLATDPCYIGTDRKGKFVLAAYYEGARVTVHAIGDDGAAVTPPALSLDTARGAHCIQTDRSNRFAFVPHIAIKGPSKIFQFRFDESTGQLTPNTPPSVTPGEELGPRHFCFHPSRDIVYCTNEQGCSVTAYHFDPAAGTLTPYQTVSTLPDYFEGKNSCAQIQISPSGKSLYAPNRGHNSIACFSIDAATGELTPAGRVAAEAVPRVLSLDPNGNFLYAAGLETGRITSYRVNGGTSELEPLETYDVGKRPMWILFTGQA